MCKYNINMIRTKRGGYANSDNNSSNNNKSIDLYEMMRSSGSRRRRDSLNIQHWIICCVGDFGRC